MKTSLNNLSPTFLPTSWSARRLTGKNNTALYRNQRVQEAAEHTIAGPSHINRRSWLYLQANGPQ